MAQRVQAMLAGLIGALLAQGLSSFKNGWVFGCTDRRVI